MNQSIYFCKSWFRAKKRPTDVWSEKQARDAHVKKKPYTILVGSVDHPTCFVEVTEKFSGVAFLDDLLRERLTYQFQSVGFGRVFLTMATYREFENDTDKVVSGTSYIFSQDGNIQIRREVFSPHRIETSTSSGSVAANFAPVPEFGEYDNLIHVERG